MPRIAVVGAGSIGVAWAVTFARSRGRVAVFDVDARRLEAAERDFRVRLDALAEHCLLADDQAEMTSRVRWCDNLPDAVGDVEYVQECGPERLEVKQQLFAQLDELTPLDATIATSSSALTASAIAGSLAGRSRCLVAHPANPPYLIPIVEIVPAPFTSPRAIERVESLMRSCEMRPVRLGAEVEGFVFNRLQGAILREAYCLVRDGVISAVELDAIVREGLARRWSVVGPFATAHLNTRGGLKAHAAIMGPAYEQMGAERGQNDPWTADLVERVADEIHEQFPLGEWEEKVEWRDHKLMQRQAAEQAQEADLD